MGLPTTQWGNPSDVYPTVPTQGDGPVLGNWQMYFVDGSAIQFVQYVASTANFNAVHLSAWQNLYQVTPTTATLQPVLGVNDQSGITVPINNCGWMKTSGLMFPLCLNATAKEAVVVSSAVTGQLATAVAGTSVEFDIVNTVLVGGSPASSPCLRIGR